jgi:hypothetical protein
VADKRRVESRTSVSIPLRIMGTEPDGRAWEEITASADLSKRGLSCTLKHRVRKGNLVLITSAMPKHYRTHDLNEASYRVWALVRSVEQAAAGGRVGFMLIGKNPPRDHEQKPGAVYLMPGDEPPDRRGTPRYTAFVTLRLVRLREGGAPEKELTVAEDFSTRGARVPTTWQVTKGEVLRVEEVGGDFASQAEVRNVYLGKDKIARLNLRFLDGRVPARLLS